MVKYYSFYALISVEFNIFYFYAEQIFWIEKHFLLEDDCQAFLHENVKEQIFRNSSDAWNLDQYFQTSFNWSLFTACICIISYNVP